MKRTILSVAAVVTLLLLSSPSAASISSSGHLVAAEQDAQLADAAFSDVESLINKATGADDESDAAAAAPSLNVSDYYHSYEALERDNAASWDLFDRVVVMGDLHGDVRKLHMVLRGAGLVSRRAALPTDPPIEAGDIYPEWHWKAKRTLLVQLGDMVDRGWYDLEVVRYLMRLEAEARAMDSAVEMPQTQPGAASDASAAEDVIVTIDTSKKVITRDATDNANSQEDRRGASRAVILLGNHELMQLSGQMHYASAQATQGWGGAATRHRDLDRDAPMGKWLRRRPVAMLAWDTIFIHAGLSPEAIAIGADGLNERMWRQLNATIAAPPPGFDSAAHEATMSERAAAERDEIRRRRDRIDALAPRKRRSSKQRHIGKTADGRDMTPEEIEAQTVQDRAFAEEEDFMLGDSGPVWTRRMVNLAQHGRCDLVMQALSAWNKSRIIVGHTPTRTAQVEAHCGGRLIAADTGLSEWMYGGKSIVELKKVRTAAGSSGRTTGAAPQGNDDTRVEVAELSFENEAEAEAAAAEIEAAEHAALHTKSSKTDSGATGVQTSEEVEAALRSDPEALQEILQLLAEQKRAADAAAKKN